MEFMLEYEVVFGDERVEDLVDDRSIPKLSNSGKALLQRAFAEYAPEMLDC
jgi:hypothetical protein